MDETTAHVVEAIGTVLAAFAAIGSIVASVIIYRGQSALAATLASDQGRISESIANQQILLSQRQLLIPLWTYISTLGTIDPQKPVGPDIIKAMNTLELVALSCEGKMVDADVIKRTFRDLYIKLYDEIDSVPNVPGRNITGRQLIRENRAAMNFYEELKKEYMSEGKIQQP